MAKIVFHSIQKLLKKKLFRFLRRGLKTDKSQELILNSSTVLFSSLCWWRTNQGQPYNPTLFEYSGYVHNGQRQESLCDISTDSFDDSSEFQEELLEESPFVDLSMSSIENTSVEGDLEEISYYDHVESASPPVPLLGVWSWGWQWYVCRYRILRYPSYDFKCQYNNLIFYLHDSRIPSHYCTLIGFIGSSMHQHAFSI